MADQLDLKPNMTLTITAPQTENQRLLEEQRQRLARPAQEPAPPPPIDPATQAQAEAARAQYRARFNAEPPAYYTQAIQEVNRSTASSWQFWRSADAQYWDRVTARVDDLRAQDAGAALYKTMYKRMPWADEVAQFMDVRERSRYWVPVVGYRQGLSDAAIWRTVVGPPTEELARQIQADRAAEHEAAINPSRMERFWRGIMHSRENEMREAQRAFQRGEY